MERRMKSICSKSVQGKIRDSAEIKDVKNILGIESFTGLKVQVSKNMPDEEILLVPEGMNVEAFDKCIEEFGYEAAKIYFSKFEDGTNFPSLEMSASKFDEAKAFRTSREFDLKSYGISFPIRQEDFEGD